MNSENASCVPIARETFIHGFFGKQQYAAMQERRLTIKLSKVLCLECKLPFISLFSLVISCIPSTNCLSNRFLPIYSLSPTSFPWINSTKGLYSRSLRSSRSPGVIMKFNSSPRSLHIRCNLNPKNQPLEYLPLCAIPLNVL